MKWIQITDVIKWIAVFDAISPALKAAMPAAQKKARRQIDVLTRAKERLMELMEEPQK